MVNRSATVSALIEPQKKENFTKILKRLGLNHSEAINIFYSLIEEYKGLPFDLRLPNEHDGQTEDVIDTEVVMRLKESMKKNRKLGKLLAQ